MPPIFAVVVDDIAVFGLVMFCAVCCSVFALILSGLMRVCVCECDDLMRKDKPILKTRLHDVYILFMMSVEISMLFAKHKEILLSTG